MDPIISKTQRYMVFPSEEEDYTVMWLDEGIPKRIGSLPSEIEVENIPAVLAFIENIYRHGIERGKKIGKKETYEFLQQQYRNYEDAKE